MCIRDRYKSTFGACLHIYSIAVALNNNKLYQNLFSGNEDNKDDVSEKDKYRLFRQMLNSFYNDEQKAVNDKVYSGLLYEIKTILFFDTDLDVYKRQVEGKDYDNLYQNYYYYNDFLQTINGVNTAFIAEQYTANAEEEYITKLSVYVANDSEYEFFANINDDEININKFVKLQLENGDTKIKLQTGYHTCLLYTSRCV